MLVYLLRQSSRRKVSLEFLVDIFICPSVIYLRQQPKDAISNE
jgi:hypothetical protein